MSCFLYIETNFIMALATGREAKAWELVELPAEELTLCIPATCFMESLVALEAELKSRQQFRDELRRQIKQARRNELSLQMSELVSALERSLLAFTEISNEFQSQFQVAFSQVAQRAQLLSLTTEILMQQSNPMLPRDLRDNLILTTILNHAEQHPGIPKAMLSGNTREFEQNEVRAALTNAGIEKYVASAEAFLSWWQAQL
jgi:hypothetical protein